MHILLPPSETKRSGGGGVFAVDALAHHPALGDTRLRVRDALVALCNESDAAAKALKLGTKNRDELLHNLVLDSSGAMPAIERYTGVLFDAIGVHDVPMPARNWLGSHLSVQSALFGLIGADDEVPAYRLSASSRLPELEAPLKRVWSHAHTDIDFAEFGWVLDLRSKDYVALAPLPAGAGDWLNVVQRGDDGEMRALNHFNKAAKGDLVRRLAISRPEIESAREFIAWADEESLEVRESSLEGQLTLVTTLGALATTSTR